jgi:DNA-directed RNA polymerase subunit E'/Rpb7
MFLPIRFKTSIELTPHDLIDDFNTIIKNKLQSKLEGICTRYGYIKPGSIEIIRRSSGKFIKQHFNGHIHFDILCKGEVCNPPKGLIVEAQVKNKNTLGLLAEGLMNINNETIPILDIIIPKKAAGILSEINIDEIEIGDTINVMIMGKRFQMNDNKISIIGRAVREKTIEKTEELDQDDEAELAGEPDEVDISDLESIEDEDDKGEQDSDDDIPLKGGNISSDKNKLIEVEDEIDDGDFEEDLEEDDVDDDEYDDGEEGGGDIYYDEP